MKARKIMSSIVAVILVVSCLCGSANAEENVFVEEPKMVISRATGRFSMDIPAGTLRQSNSSFLLDPGEVVTIKASYSPFSANVDFGLITPDGWFYHFTVTDGSVDQAMEITERGEYTFAIRNNSSYSINVSGYVNY